MTVRFTVGLFRVPTAARMVAVPVETPVATPLPLMVATAVGFEVQVTPVVIGAVVWFVPVAV